MLLKPSPSKSYKQKLLDPRWQKLRLQVLNRENFTCQICSDKESTLHVHHHYYPETGNPWDVDEFALSCFCENCHAMSHAKNLSPDAKKIIGELEFIANMFGGKCDQINFLMQYMNKVITKMDKNG